MKQARRWLRPLGILLGAGLLLFQVYQGWQAVRLQEIRLVSPGYLALSILPVMLAIFQQVVSWRILMLAINIRIPYRDVFRGYLLSFLPRYIPGTVWGYISRNEWLYQDYGVDYTLSSFGSILEIVVSIVASAMMACLFFVAYPAVQYKVWIGILVLVMPFLSWWVGSVLLKVGVVQKIFKKLEVKTLEVINLPRWLLSVLLITVNWFYYGFSLYLVVLGVGQTTSINLYSLVIFAGSYSLAWLLGFLVLFLPSGLGLREWVLAYLLSWGFSLTSFEASAVAITFRLIVVLAELLWIALVAVRWVGGHASRIAADKGDVAPR